MTECSKSINVLELKGRDLAYWERNQLILYLTKLFPSWLERHPSEDIEWEDDWRNIVFIETPEGICCWHFHDFEYDYFSHLKFREGNSWDGSSTFQKYDKLRTRGFYNTHSLPDAT